MTKLEYLQRARNRLNAAEALATTGVATPPASGDADLDAIYASHAADDVREYAEDAKKAASLAIADLQAFVNYTSEPTGT